MLNDTRIENIAVQSGKQSVFALIETQTILQLLFEDIFAKRLKGEELTSEEDNYLRNVADQML